MNVLDSYAILVAKAAGMLIRTFRLGAGATWPGEIALRIRPRILKSLLLREQTVVIVAGTNGKTTTSKMLSDILTASGHRVTRNESGANLDNGIVSALIADSTFRGAARSDTYIFEVDEASLPKILPSVNPTVIVLLNLFRDQLDRYGEIDTIADKWHAALKRLTYPTTLVVNADDPFLATIVRDTGKQAVFFGLENPDLGKKEIDHAADTVHCPLCGHRLTFGAVYFSHLGKWACGRCGLTHPDVSVSSKDFRSPLEGVYNVYNTIASSLAARILGVKDDVIRKGLREFKPAFGRMEDITVRGKEVRILLSKNPTGMNESIRTILGSPLQGPVLFLLNDRIPDGTDVSWIWDVDFELLASYPYPIYVSGDRYLDLAVRLKYAGVRPKQLIPVQEIGIAVDRAIAGVPGGKRLWILPTYSAMLQTRKLLTGRKIL